MREHMYPGEPGPLGNECVGEVLAVGENVEGFEIGAPVIALASRAFCSHVNALAELAVRRPAFLSVEAAATIPITFLTAEYALNHLGGMQAGDRVLIHAAAGGVGMAAVQLAQRCGAEVIATAGSPEKREFLRSLGIRHVMSSRNLDFSRQVMEVTAGEGVDIVLNSLADDFIPKSMSVLNQGGRFLELGKTDLWDSEKFARVNPHASYRRVFLGDVCRNNPALVNTWFKSLIDLLEEGELKPLPYKLFPITEAAQAFRYMAQAQHTGKIVIDQRSMSKNVVVRLKATYLITGGTGGIGLCAAQWLVAKGARHLMLFARRPADEHAEEAIHRLRDIGAEVTVFLGDIGKPDDVKGLLAKIDARYPLTGIIHAAGVIDDAMLVNQDRERFEAVMRPKVSGTWLLHRMTRQTNMDFFVMCSAGAALFGSPGQANYAAGNAFMDGLAHYRQDLGLPALSINWGPWAEVGMAAALDSREHERWTSMGVGMIEPAQGLQALELALKQGVPQVAVLPMNWTTYFNRFEFGASPPFLSEIARKIRPQHPGEPSSVQEGDFLRQLEACDPEDRRDAILNHVREQIIDALGFRPSMELKLDQGFTDLGMDSLMAVEISNRLKLSLGCSLPSTIAFEHPTLKALTDYLATEVLGVKSTDTGQAELNKEDAVQVNVKKEVENLSEDDIEKTLIQELEDTGY